MFSSPLCCFLCWGRSWDKLMHPISWLNTWWRLHEFFWVLSKGQFLTSSFSVWSSFFLIIFLAITCHLCRKNLYTALKEEDLCITWWNKGFIFLAYILTPLVCPLRHPLEPPWGGRWGSLPLTAAVERWPPDSESHSRPRAPKAPSFLLQLWETCRLFKGTRPNSHFWKICCVVRLAAPADWQGFGSDPSHCLHSHHRSRAALQELYVHIPQSVLFSYCYIRWSFTIFQPIMWNDTFTQWLPDWNTAYK